MFLVGSAVMLALVFGVAATALGAMGGTFVLGQSNSANKQTTLVGSVADVAKSALRVDNKGGRPALHLRVGNAETPANDIAPMKVNSSKKVDNLNVDSLDGNSSEAFFRYDSTIPPGTTITGAFGGGEQDSTDLPPTRPPSPTSRW